MSPRNNRAPPIITDDHEQLAPVHFEWVKITVWRTVYETRKRGKRWVSDQSAHRSRPRRKAQFSITIFSLERPTAQRILKTPRGDRVFHAIACRREERGFIEKIHNVIPRTVHNPTGADQTMAKNKTKNKVDTTDETETTTPDAAEAPDTRATKAKGKKNKNKDAAAEGTNEDASVEEELAKLEQLVDAEDEDSNPDTDDDPDDAPKSKKKNRQNPSQSRAAKDGKVGTREIAEAANVDSRTLRMVLRKHRDWIVKDEETGRYEWDSLKDPVVKRILKLIEGGAARDVKRESLDKLKRSQAEKKAAKGEKGKDGKKNKKGKKNKA